MKAHLDSGRMNLEHRPLFDDLLFELRKNILLGNFQDGKKLTEQYLCDTYQVSRTPVREALRQLAAEGLIETIPNRGAFVTAFTAQDLSDLYELRKAYEILATRWAVERITKEELAELEEAFEFMEFYTQKSDPEKMLNINMQFHDLIYRAAHNKRLHSVLSSYQLYIKQTKANTAYLNGKLEEVLDEHRSIYRAFLDEDPEAGAAAAALHLENAKKRSGLK
ncbi:MAG: GntR family transcriptional regulator [Bacillota bacterium]|nr:GntR family transcriptional regulator [Bacillota bacterium]